MYTHTIDARIYKYLRGRNKIRVVSTKATVTLHALCIQYPHNLRTLYTVDYTEHIQMRENRIDDICCCQGIDSKTIIQT